METRKKRKVSSRCDEPSQGPPVGLGENALQLV